MVGVYNKIAARDQTTIGAYRQQMVEQFLQHARLRGCRDAQKADAPFSWPKPVADGS